MSFEEQGMVATITTRMPNGDLVKIDAERPDARRIFAALDKLYDGEGDVRTVMDIALQVAGYTETADGT